MEGVQTQPQVTLSYRFTYDGTVRHVDNVTLEGDAQQIIGMEMRKAGKFSHRIKRYSLVKITDLQRIDPFERSGPVLGLPA